jgi:6-pyruvoyltetrahydropterin/6-carboxytetrahydropterin synthase
VYVGFDAEIKEDGIVFDYTVVKSHIESMCVELNEHFLLPARSRHIRIEKKPDYIYVHFNNEKIPFLPRDIKILPLENITVEDLASYFLDEFVREFVQKNDYAIVAVEVRVFSGPGQSANAVWQGAV